MVILRVIILTKNVCILQLHYQLLRWHNFHMHLLVFSKINAIFVSKQRIIVKPQNDGFQVCNKYRQNMHQIKVLFKSTL